MSLRHPSRHFTLRKGFKVWGTPGSRGWVGGVMLVPRTFPELAGNIKVTFCMYVPIYLCTLFPPDPPDQSPPNFAQTSPPTQGRFLHKHDPANPTPGLQGTPNSKIQMGHGRENFVQRKMPRWVPLCCLVNFPDSAGARLAS